MTNLSPYYKEFAPPAVSASLIGAFWSFSVPIQTNGSIQHRVLPDGCMDLIFQYQRSPDGEIHNPQLIIYGATDRFDLFEVKPGTELVGVRFHPGMAGQFLKLNAIGLFQQETKAEDCSPAFVRIFDRLCECHSAEQVLSRLQSSLLEMHTESEDSISLSICEALRLISSSNGRMAVSDVADAVGVSERTMRRGITAAVGLSPKVLARILRLQHAVSQLRSPNADLCCVALECGYADQAHMGREFQQLAGLTPTAFTL
jgi:AraC-like DNA-binding protein